MFTCFIYHYVYIFYDLLYVFFYEIDIGIVLYVIEVDHVIKFKVLGQIGLSKQCRPRSDCSIKEQSDQGLHCLPFQLNNELQNQTVPF